MHYLDIAIIRRLHLDKIGVYSTEYEYTIGFSDSFFFSGSTLKHLPAN